MTRDAQGTFHYSTENALTVHHEPNIVPGAPNAPATMQFRLTDGF